LGEEESWKAARSQGTEGKRKVAKVWIWEEGKRVERKGSTESKDVVGGGTFK